MIKKSAGILAYRKRNQLEVLLAHPGGPFFRNKDVGAWTIPKGEIGADEEPITAAISEFFEETGIELSGNFIELGQIKQKAGKIILAWAIETEIDVSKISSNTFTIEWPPKSKKFQEFPEIDKVDWFTVEEADVKIIEAQRELIRRLEKILDQ